MCVCVCVSVHYYYNSIVHYVCVFTWDSFKFFITRESNTIWSRNLGGICTRTLLRKTNQNLLFIREKVTIYCRPFIHTNPTKTHNEKGNFWIRVAKACTSKTGAHRTFRFPHVPSKNGSKPARFLFGTWFLLSLALNHALRSRDYRCCRIHLIHF